MKNDSSLRVEVPEVDSDRHLLARARLRDTAAYERLFHRYYQPVRQMLVRTLADETLADDLAQETFLALYSHPPQPQTDGEGVRAWLFRVALNRGYNALRARRRARDHLADLYVPDPVVDPEAEVLRAEERASVQAALMLLPERQAKLLILRQQEGLKYAEIAEILHVAPGSVGTLLVRAERAFQLAWEHLHGTSPNSTAKGAHSS